MSVWSSFPTETERRKQEEEYQSEIELKRYTTFDPDVELAQTNTWEQNRQIFMNLPKTPNTPGFGLNPMTPRTVAFTQLNGGPGPSRPTGSLPFREQYGDQKASDGR